MDGLLAELEPIVKGKLLDFYASRALTDLGSL